MGIRNQSRAVVAAMGVLVMLTLAGCAPEPEQPATEIEGLELFENLTAVHIDPDPVDYEAEYGMLPPAGGDHHQAWLNCGVYNQPVPNENAVHSMEHGAVWVTYDPDVVSDADALTLRQSLPGEYIVLSPFPGLPAPVVASAWGAQVKLDGIDDERLGAFVSQFWKSPAGPEPGAPCTGALDAPGRVG